MIEKPTEPFEWSPAGVGEYYVAGLTGYTGLDYHSVAQLSKRPAVRSQMGGRGLYKASMAILPNGDIIASPVDMLHPSIASPYPTGTPNEFFGEEPQLKNWPVRLHISRDNGASWEPMEHTPLLGKENSLTCLDDGSLLFMGESVDAVCRSEDGGHTWTMIPMETPRESYQSVSIVRGPIFQSDGTISIMRCVGTHEGWSNVDAPANCRAWLRHSSDCGRSWSDLEPVEVWDDSFAMFVESDFLTLPDGRLLATSRFEYDHPIEGTSPPHPPGSVPNDHAAGHIVLMESADGGRTWTEPQDFLNYSEVHAHLALLSDGRILCTHLNYHLPFGTGAVVSNDLGETWDFDHPFQLSISNGPSNGWPTTRQLADGTLLTIYALSPYYQEPEESGRSVVHTVRWELP